MSEVRVGRGRRQRWTCEFVSDVPPVGKKIEKKNKVCI